MVKRPPLRYHGGKWKLAPWIVSHFPEHRVYVEPFGGGGSVLLRKPRSYSEVYNDIESEIVNLFRVLRDTEQAARLRAALELTPFARDEFVGAYDETDQDTIERARRLVIRGFMGFGSAAMTRTHRTGFRANSNRSGTTPAHDWANYPRQLESFCDRLRGVVIENRPAAEVIAQHDSPETLIYADPPYVHDTRSFPRGASQPFCYKYEMTDDDHRALAEQLRGVAGKVVLSGYPCDLYGPRAVRGLAPGRARPLRRRRTRPNRSAVAQLHARRGAVRPPHRPRARWAMTAAPVRRVPRMDLTTPRRGGRTG
jgi:DNA adenine methylase